MITYSYSEYSPEDDNQFSIDRLMSILSEMIMKYDISLEEALKLLIEKGIPANLFLKEAGMNDLVEKYLDQIKELVNKILSENKISPNIQNLENEISSKKKDINDKKIDPGYMTFFPGEVASFSNSCDSNHNNILNL
jgi:hypothetical protein